MHEQKIKDLQTKRDELVKNHQILSTQLNDITVSVHQIDGAIGVLIELQKETEESKPETNSKAEAYKLN